MKDMFTYIDAATGYTVTQYTKGDMRNAKLYFTTENFAADDRSFFFRRYLSNALGAENELYRCDVCGGEYYRVLDSRYKGFAMSREDSYGVVTDQSRIYRFDCDSETLTEIGAFPEVEKGLSKIGGRVTGHLTTSKSGLVMYSYQQLNKIFALVVLDPRTGKSETVHRSDYHLGHTQACPGDDNTIFYIHETGGDALQRMWMFDIAQGTTRPYYLEREDDWITHEVWTADGESMLFMKYPHFIMRGSKDGHYFSVVTETDKQFLHPGISQNKRLVCADRVEFTKENDQGIHSGVWLIDPATGAQRELVRTGFSKTGDDHPHPSFNRAGNLLYFSKPDPETGIAQIAVINLAQVDLYQTAVEGVSV
ncbi:MAG: oligogalacturonate lyase family protein [Bacillota bacterium]